MLYYVLASEYVLLIQKLNLLKLHYFKVVTNLQFKPGKLSMRYLSQQQDSDKGFFDKRSNLYKGIIITIISLCIFLMIYAFKDNEYGATMIIFTILTHFSVIFLLGFQAMSLPQQNKDTKNLYRMSSRQIYEANNYSKRDNSNDSIVKYRAVERRHMNLKQAQVQQKKIRDKIQQYHYLDALKNQPQPQAFDNQFKKIFIEQRNKRAINQSKHLQNYEKQLRQSKNLLPQQPLNQKYRSMQKINYKSPIDSRFVERKTLNTKYQLPQTKDKLFQNRSHSRNYNYGARISISPLKSRRYEDKQVIPPSKYYYKAQKYQRINDLYSNKAQNRASIAFSPDKILDRKPYELNHIYALQPISMKIFTKLGYDKEQKIMSIITYLKDYFRSRFEQAHSQQRQYFDRAQNLGTKLLKTNWYNKSQQEVVKTLRTFIQKYEAGNEVEILSKSYAFGEQIQYRKDFDEVKKYMSKIQDIVFSLNPKNLFYFCMKLAEQNFLIGKKLVLVPFQKYNSSFDPSKTEKNSILIAYDEKDDFAYVNKEQKMNPHNFQETLLIVMLENKNDWTPLWKRRVQGVLTQK